MPNTLEKYANQYFTGTQASIWVGDIWVDECTGIQFAASQSVIPVYGYASTFFDAVAKGKVIVQGAFEINFIDEGYLYSILREGYTKWLNSNADEATVRSAVKKGLVETAEISAPRRTPAEVIQEQINLLRDVNEVASSALNKGGNAVRNASRSRVMNQILDTLSQLDIAGVQQLGRNLEESRFPKQSRNVIYEMIPFTLQGRFGNPEIYGREQGTLKEIKDCFLVGNELVLGSNDEVIKERYSFIARQHI